MKVKMSKAQLQTTDEIWNAVIEVISEDGPLAVDPIWSEACMAFHYYSEMESGGHESLLNGSQEYIEQQGFPLFLEQLIHTLQKIGAADYAEIEKKYGNKIGHLFLAMGRVEEDEKAFYEIIEKADQEYYLLDGDI
ncbi:hypothetical protein FQV26_08710 [Planococcus sp. CPCC 101016]|uniref:hypothetical protein n=1 Tax=Planococcus sp. CPCC 101016 TaxID=2599617 RepID=UPI0011B478FE|nr:hypothetical protein [Planococcus sp. CPCC 101016]TWT07877.1 hypothetical protein FQV26_08710 [Planococcus sp. CPCC 101016]